MCVSEHSYIYKTVHAGFPCNFSSFCRFLNPPLRHYSDNLINDFNAYHHVNIDKVYKNKTGNSAVFQNSGQRRPPRDHHSELLVASIGLIFDCIECSDSVRLVCSKCGRGDLRPVSGRSRRGHVTWARGGVPRANINFVRGRLSNLRNFSNRVYT